MRDAVAALAAWRRRRGHQIGFVSASRRALRRWGRSDLKVASTTARSALSSARRALSDAAADGQILVTSRVAGAVGDLAELSDIGGVIKGSDLTLPASNVVALKSGRHQKIVTLNRQTR
jgi:hypothetical protein